MGSKIKIGNLIALPRIGIFLVSKVLRQKKFIRKTIEKELLFFRKKNDGSLTSRDFKKITEYYALGVPAILGEAFSVLRGFPMSRKERICISYLGGMSGLLDDLFDDPGKEEAPLKQFILQPEKLQPSNSYESVLSYFYNHGLQNASHPEEIKKKALQVFQSQQKSKRQNLPGLSESEIWKLTREKGGTSFLFYRLCLDHPLSVSEEKFHYNIGGLMQLGNDIFDVWEDQESGISTLATITTDIRQLRKKFKFETEQCYRALLATEFSQKNKRRFLHFINLTLARIFVCLDQFEQLQRSSDNIFIPEEYTRKQLICDMEKPGNQLKAIKYYLSFEFRSFLT